MLQETILPERAATAWRRGLIYDIGMHLGEDADFYLRKGFSVVGIEANPACVRHCRDRFRVQIQKGTMTVVEGAVAEPGKNLGSGAQVVFYRNLHRSVWGTVSLARALENEEAGAPSETIDVPFVDLHECFASYGVPYFMEIDTEGSERYCLKELMRGSLRPAYISIESDQLQFGVIREEFELFLALGYDAYKIIRQDRVHCLRLPVPAQEGRHVAHRFSPGASGPFGLELPGSWMSDREALKHYRVLVLLYRLFGERSRSMSARGLNLIHRLMKGRCSHKDRAGRANTAVPSRLGCLRPGWYDTHARHCSMSEHPATESVHKSSQTVSP